MQHVSYWYLNTSLFLAGFVLRLLSKLSWCGDCWWHLQGIWSPHHTDYSWNLYTYCPPLWGQGRRSCPQLWHRLTRGGQAGAGVPTGGGRQDADPFWGRLAGLGIPSGGGQSQGGESLRGSGEGKHVDRWGGLEIGLPLFLRDARRTQPSPFSMENRISEVLVWLRCIFSAQSSTAARAGRSQPLTGHWDLKHLLGGSLLKVLGLKVAALTYITVNATD